MELNTIEGIKELTEEQIKRLEPNKLGEAFSVAFGHGSLTAFALELNKSYITIYRTFKGLSKNQRIIEQAQKKLIIFSKD